MNDVYTWWLVLVGVGIGVAGAWLVLGQFGTGDDARDGSDQEARAAESAWIADVIGQQGGYAPPPLVHEILDLHDHYEGQR